MKTNNLRITNTVLTGKIPFQRKLKLEEVNKLIQKFNWVSINDETSPILQKRIFKEGKSVHHKQKCICVSLWTSGAINIVGAVSRKEGNQGYDLAVNDLKKVCRSVLK